LLKLKQNYVNRREVTNFIEIIEDSQTSGFPQDKLRFAFRWNPMGICILVMPTICLNFGLGIEMYNAPVNLRFDRYQPAKEQEYVDAIKDILLWLGLN
jgi:glutaminyl-tRNA synthetase